MDLPLLTPFWLNWFVLALGLFCLNLLLRSSGLTRLGVAALLAALAARLLGDEFWPLHFFIFAGLAVATLCLGRGKKRPGSGQFNLFSRSNRVRKAASGQTQEGRRFCLESPMPGGNGQARLGGVTYSLRGPELPAGTEVVVLEQQGETLLVTGAAQADSGDF